jgi:hypothetical protein
MHLRVNKHGVKGAQVAIGRMFRASDGSTSIFVPEVCLDCSNYDSGEWGDYGTKLSPPYCERNVWWPTHKGTCRKKNKP